VRDHVCYLPCLFRRSVEFGVHVGMFCLMIDLTLNLTFILCISYMLKKSPFCELSLAYIMSFSYPDDVDDGYNG